MQWRACGVALLVGAALVGSTGCARAEAVRSVTPETLARELGRSNGGDKLILAPGDYADVKLVGLHFDPPVTLDASAATLTVWWLKDVQGLTILGGTIRPRYAGPHPRTGDPMWTTAMTVEKSDHIQVRDAAVSGPGRADAATSGAWGEGYGVQIAGSKDIAVTHNAFSGLKVGLVVGDTEDFQIADNKFAAMRADGMDVAQSRRGVIERNECGATVIRGGEHPDCIQLWSRPDKPPVSDIVIRKNKVRGDTQGISLFNHVRNGVDDGGYDRITIEDNDLEVSAPQAINLSEGRQSTVRRNHVKTAPGARYRASINVTGEVQRCGNTVEPGAGKPGIFEPRC